MATQVNREKLAERSNEPEATRSDAESAAVDKERACAPSSVPTLNVQGRKAMRATRPETPPPARATSSTPPPASIPPLLAALVASVPPFSTRSSSVPPRPTSSVPPRPTTSSVPPAAASAANDTLRPPAPKGSTERTTRIGSIRVAIAGPIDARLFSAQRLHKGQPLPQGAVQAMLVFTGTIDGSTGPNQRASGFSATAAAPESGERRAGTIRVAVRPPRLDALSFWVERLDAGQAAPADTSEAMLVFTTGIEGALEIETFVRAAGL